MSLYLAIFNGDEELVGVEVGHYSDFEHFRTYVTRLVERGVAGSACPVLVLHSDCDGQWSPNEAQDLLNELQLVASRFRSAPPILLGNGWQQATLSDKGICPQSLYECFIDVDGNALVERLEYLARESSRLQLPILFQ